MVDLEPEHSKRKKGSGDKNVKKKRTRRDRSSSTLSAESGGGNASDSESSDEEDDNWSLLAYTWPLEDRYKKLLSLYQDYLVNNLFNYVAPLVKSASE